LLGYRSHHFRLVETRDGTTPMKRHIIGFDQDEEGYWRAILDCGHPQHVRHEPPLRTREWVLTDAGRNSRLGAELDCRKCGEERAA
jgi:hypothetical protein